MKGRFWVGRVKARIRHALCGLWGHRWRKFLSGERCTRCGLTVGVTVAEHFAKAIADTKAFWDYGPLQ